MQTLHLFNYMPASAQGTPPSQHHHHQLFVAFHTGQSMSFIHVHVPPMLVRSGSNISSWGWVAAVTSRKVQACDPSGGGECQNNAKEEDNWFSPLLRFGKAHVRAQTVEKVSRGWPQMGTILIVPAPDAQKIINSDSKAPFGLLYTNVYNSLFGLMTPFTRDA